jgi:hypothetical protein
VLGSEREDVRQRPRTRAGASRGERLERRERRTWTGPAGAAPLGGALPSPQPMPHHPGPSSVRGGAPARYPKRPSRHRPGHILLGDRPGPRPDRTVISRRPGRGLSLRAADDRGGRRTSDMGRSSAKSMDSISQAGLSIEPNRPTMGSSWWVAAPVHGQRGGPDECGGREGARRSGTMGRRPATPAVVGHHGDL